MDYYKFASIDTKQSIIVSEDIHEYFKEPEPMSTLELVTSTGFTRMMLLIWSPVIILVLIILLINYLGKNVKFNSKPKKRKKKKRRRL